MRRLRRLFESGRFEADFADLSAEQQEQVLAVLRTMRKEAELPGPDDVDEILPPCSRPAGWRRQVPGTELWVYYDLRGELGVDISLRFVRVPPRLSDAALEALRKELEERSPAPHLKPVPDRPNDP
jgi:hypothetical protein